MQYGNCQLKIDKAGNTVPIFNLTPPQAVILRAAHEGNAQGDPILNLFIEGEDDRSDTDEYNRLQQLYPGLNKDPKNPKINQLTITYPGVNPKFPATFREAGFVSAVEEAQKVLKKAAALEEAALEVATRPAQQPITIEPVVHES